ncbi:MAG: glycosyltransferase family 39 protein, partial [Solirubrobacteraceae bacterium]
MIAVALIACITGLWNDYAHDDVSLIADNVRAHGITSWGAIFASPYWPPPFAPELYRPIVSAMMLVEYVFGAGAPMAFRIVSSVLYAASAVAVFAFAARVMSRHAALAIALLFAAHPVHVEAVALGVNQAELVVGLLAAVMTLRYVDIRRTRALTGKDWMIFCALYALAALAKENGFVIPALLVSAEVFLVNDEPLRKRAAKSWPGFAAMAAVGVALLLIRRAVLHDAIGTFTAEALVGATWRERLLTTLQIVPQWLRLLAWPAHLQIDYSPNEIVASKAFGPIEALGLALVLGAVAVVIAARRRAPAVSFGLAWCGVALLPVANVVVPTSIVLAERTLFLPSVGFLIAVGGAPEWVLCAPRL